MVAMLYRGFGRCNTKNNMTIEKAERMAEVLTRSCFTGDGRTAQTITIPKRTLVDTLLAVYREAYMKGVADAGRTEAA